MKHNFGRELENYEKTELRKSRPAGKYNQEEMQKEVVREYVQALEMMKPEIATKFCIEYLEGRGYSVIRIT
ncbi:hypothetical protein LCGC14_1644320 [marine sediment metagenome]|uniref:Uncharacterized protein n=1 Tax=marine sediment metagenome TaxID=412755 RepID=A0A0F9HZH4_9ZZZZ